MAVGIAPATAQDMMEAYATGAAWAGVSAHFVQLHLGDPGAAGTANPAAETERQSATFSVTSGAAENSAAVEWTGVTATETVTHFSVWTAATGGDFVGSGTVTGGDLTAGGDASFQAGDLTMTFNLAA